MCCAQCNEHANLSQMNLIIKLSLLTFGHVSTRASLCVKETKWARSNWNTSTTRTFMLVSCIYLDAYLFLHQDFYRKKVFLEHIVRSFFSLCVRLKGIAQGKKTIFIEYIRMVLKAIYIHIFGSKLIWMYKFDPKRDPNEKLIAGSRPSIGPLFFLSHLSLHLTLSIKLVASSLFSIRIFLKWILMRI